MSKRIHNATESSAIISIGQSGLRSFVLPIKKLFLNGCWSQVLSSFGTTQRTKHMDAEIQRFDARAGHEQFRVGPIWSFSRWKPGLCLLTLLLAQYHQGSVRRLIKPFVTAFQACKPADSSRYFTHKMLNF